MEASISGYVRRHHLGLVAVFIALTGTAWAGTQAGPRDIAKNAVRAKHVKNGQIGTRDVADGNTAKGLTGADIAANSLGGNHVIDDSLDAGDIADRSSLGTAEIDEGDLFNDDSIQDSDIAEGGVGPSEIAEDGVGAPEIATGGVGTAEIANNTITADDVVDNGSIAAYFAGSFTAGRPPASGDPNASLVVTDDFGAISRASPGGGGNSVFVVNTASGSEQLTMFGEVDVEDAYIELDEIATPAAPLANAGRLYLRDSGGTTQLVIDWNAGATDVLASE